MCLHRGSSSTPSPGILQGGLRMPATGRSGSGLLLSLMKPLRRAKWQMCPCDTGHSWTCSGYPITVTMGVRMHNVMRSAMLNNLLQQTFPPDNPTPQHLSDMHMTCDHVHCVWRALLTHGGVIERASASSETTLAVKRAQVCVAALPDFQLLLCEDLKPISTHPALAVHGSVSISSTVSDAV